MTPNRYSLKELKKLLPQLSGNDISLYHWTNRKALIDILNDQKLYSKATLWGFNYTFTPQAKTKVADAENGFIDYVFLGTTPWPIEAKFSSYGEFGVQLSLDILNEKEFFVSKVNTGFQWQNLKQEDRFSDLSTIFQALTNNIRTTEFLVRRKVPIDPQHVIKIYCPNDKVEDLCENINVPDLRSKVEGYQAMQIKIDGKPTLSLTYPNFTDGEEEIKADRYKIDGDICYIFHPDSTCVLTLKVDGNKLFDFSNNREVGKII